MIKQDILEKQVKSIYLGIGSNLGNKKYNIERAKIELLKNVIKIVNSSNFYQSLSWPNPINPEFLNIVLEIKTNFNPLKLLKICKEIESYLGRKRAPKNAPRSCDIDIIDYQNLSIKSGITIPHPRMHTRNFVLLPLFELNKEWTHPISKFHIKRLILALPNKDITSIKQI